MKHFTMALSLLLVCLVFLVLGTNQRVFGEEGPDTRPISGGGGMPGYPVPARPIPHHEPGHPARGTDYSTQVERINAQGVEENVQLTGLDAMLADGVMDDPLQGNYRLVGLDKLMFASYHVNHLYEETYKYEDPTLSVVPASYANMGDHRFYDIAAGDLNGDLVDEQITAWVGDGNRIFMSIGEMPGSQGRVTSGPAIVDGVIYPYTVRGYDDALWYHDGSGWKNAGGRLLSAPAIVSQGNGQTTAFAIGTDNQVFRTSLMNRAVQFDGVDDYVEADAAITGTGPFAVATWVKTTETREQTIIQQRSPSVYNGEYQLLLSPDGRVVWWTFGDDQDGFQITSSGRVNDGNWHHIAAIRENNGTGKIYIDGELDSFQASEPRTLVSTQVYIGADMRDMQQYFRGSIDEVAVFNRALSGVEITTIYQSGWDSISGKILGLHLDENFAGDGWVLVDASGQGNDATLYTFEGDANKSVTSVKWQPVIPQGDWPPVEAWQGPTPELPAPAVLASDGQLDLFRLGPDNTLRWQHSDDGSSWGDWQNLDGMLASGPGAISLGPDHMQVFARGVDDALWAITYNGSDWDWQRIDRDGMPEGVTIASAPAVVSPAANQLLVMVHASDDRLWQLTYDGSSWGDWQPAVGLPADVIFASAPAMAAYGDQIHLIARTSEGKQFVWLYDGSSWGDKYDMPGLEVDAVYSLNFRTVQPPGIDAVDNWLLDIETGQFVGDGREQIVLASQSPWGGAIHLYDVHDGFVPLEIALLPGPIGGTVPRITAGDVDGDGVDEIGCVYIPDDKHYQLKVFRFNKETGGNWPVTLVEVFDSGPIWAENYVFGGTLRIAAGDIVPEPDPSNDEFAVVSDWYNNHDHRDQLITRINLYDDDPDPKFSFGPWVFYQATKDTYYNRYYTGIGLAVGDVDGPQPGYGIDEIVVTWPRGFDDDDWPDLERDLVVWGWDSDFVQKCSYEIPGYSRWSYLDTLAVGDLDQDLKDEIVMASHQNNKHPGSGYYLDVYEYETLSTGPIVHQDLPGSSAYNLAMGDLTGESVRVGPPSYRRQHDVGQVIAVVNAPPKHKDVVDNVEYNLNADDADTYSQFERVTGTSTEVSVTTKKDWSVDSEFKSTIGDPDATHVTTSIKNSYGENFENTGSSTQSLTYQQSMKAITDDVLYYTRLDYDVWEYPVYDSLTYAPQGSMSVIWPVGGMQDAVEPANSCDGWYKPNHQLMNVWSYPSTADQLLDRNESADLYNAPLYTIGTEQVDFSVDFSNVSMESRSHEYELGFAGSFESQIGGEEVGVNLGVVSFSTRLPSLYFSTSGEYNSSELAEWQTETTEATSLSGYFNPIPEGIDYRYAVQPYLYWSDSDYLVLDYVTDPSDQAFWSPSGDKYNRPDPAFIRPWAEGQCNHLWPDAEYITSDITIDPPMAKAGEPVTITATLRNFSEVGNGSAPFNQPFKVSFYQGDPDAGGSLIGQQTIAVGDLKPRTEKAVITRSIQWVSEGSGEQHIYAVIDPEDALSEVHDENDPGVNNNKGYAVLSMNTIDFVDAGQAVEKAYHAVTLELGDPAPISTLFVPLGTFTETMRMDMQTAVEFAGWHSVGSPFEIIPYQTDWENPEPEFTFIPDEGDPPAVISLDYAGTDLTGFDENLLTLYRYTGSDWVEATCLGYATERFPDDNLIAVPVCQTGIFALSDRTPTLLDQKFYLPLVLE